MGHVKGEGPALPLIPGFTLAQGSSLEPDPYTKMTYLRHERPFMPRIHPSASMLLVLFAACNDQPATSPLESNRPDFADVSLGSCDELQAALDDPEANVITLPEGAVCYGHFDLPSRSITLQGPGTGATFDGTTDGGQVQILSGDDVGGTVIRNLTFRNGAASSDGPESGRGGAISLTGALAPTISNNTFLDNSAEENGGAISLTGDAAPTIEDNTFLGNSVVAV